jgi:pilus assembly protein CpaF
MDSEGQVQGHFESTGIRPRFVDHLNARGVTLPPELFRPEVKLDA